MVQLEELQNATASSDDEDEAPSGEESGSSNSDALPLSTPKGPCPHWDSLTHHPPLQWHLLLAPICVHLDLHWLLLVSLWSSKSSSVDWCRLS